jgi:hypothetical protein
MNSSLFRTCRLKLQRAREHADAIKVLAEQLFRIEANQPVIAIREMGPKDEYAIYVARMPELSDAFDRVSLVLGDAIHNLRSSLDHLVFQLAIAHTSGVLNDERGIRFPIAANQASFEKAAGRALKALSAAHITIIESFQPYHPYQARLQYSEQMGGHFHPLAKLQELSNRDKHRQALGVVIPTNLGIAFDEEANSVAAIFGAAVRQRTFSPNQPASFGREIARAIVPNLQISTANTAQLAVEFALDEGRPILITLERLAAFVDQIVEAFEAAP